MNRKVYEYEDLTSTIIDLTNVQVNRSLNHTKHCCFYAMTKATMVLGLLLGINIWSVLGQSMCNRKGACYNQLDKRDENQILKPLSVFRKFNEQRQYNELPILKQLIYPKNAIRHNLGRITYPVRVRISRSGLKKHLKSQNMKMSYRHKETSRRKFQHFKNSFRHKKERLRRNMSYNYRKRCIFLPQDTVQLIKNLHLQKMKQHPMEGVLCRIGTPSRFIATPRYYG